MTKFTIDIKTKIVDDYIKGLNSKEIIRKYGISPSYYKYIIRLYNTYGYSGLISNKNFSAKDKLKLIMEVKSGKSISNVAVKYKLSSYGILHKWITDYEKFVYNILSKSQGRLIMGKKPINQKETAQEKIKRLEKKIKYLEAENEYFKTLQEILKNEKK